MMISINNINVYIHQKQFDRNEIMKIKYIATVEMVEYQI